MDNLLVEFMLNMVVRFCISMHFGVFVWYYSRHTCNVSIGFIILTLHFDLPEKSINLPVKCLFLPDKFDSLNTCVQSCNSSNMAKIMIKL